MGFYNGQVGKINRLKGFVMINNFEDKQKAVNISFWETRENMDIIIRMIRISLFLVTFGQGTRNRK